MSAGIVRQSRITNILAASTAAVGASAAASAAINAARDTYNAINIRLLLPDRSAMNDNAQTAPSESAICHIGCRLPTPQIATSWKRASMPLDKPASNASSTVAPVA